MKVTLLVNAFEPSAAEAGSGDPRHDQSIKWIGILKARSGI